jgi:hypothetical protein
MESFFWNVEMADRPDSGASPKSSSAIPEPPGAQSSHRDSIDTMQLARSPDFAFTELPTELTTYLSGDTTPRANNNDVAPVPQFPQFDPRALLNPRTQVSKRPASSGGDADRGRIDPTIAGQVSLVERLHNVQERTASPAKRVKTDENRRKTANIATFGGGSALDLQQANDQASAQQGPAIDLTMSECLEF